MSTPNPTDLPAPSPNNSCTLEMQSPVMSGPRRNAAPVDTDTPSLPSNVADALSCSNAAIPRHRSPQVTHAEEAIAGSSVGCGQTVRVRRAQVNAAERAPPTRTPDAAGAASADRGRLRLLIVARSDLVHTFRHVEAFTCLHRHGANCSSSPRSTEFDPSPSTAAPTANDGESSYDTPTSKAVPSPAISMVPPSLSTCV